MHRNRNVVLAAVLSVAVASCADAQRTAPPPTITDSAGIRIVTNLLPTRSAATVTPTPSIDVGGGSDPTGELAGVVAAVRLTDGRVAIAEQSTRSIKLFDARGRFVRAMGRQGQGPGEFSSITRLELLPGDSIAAYDGLRATLTVFDTTGRVVRTERLVAGAGGLELRGMLADGTLILSQAYNVMFGRTSRLERDPITYMAKRQSRAELDTVAKVAGTEVFLFAGDDFSSRRPRPFGKVSLIGVARDRLLVGTGDGWQLEVRRPDGRLVELHRLNYAPPAVSKPDIARYKKEFLAQMKTARVSAAGGGGDRPDMRSAMVMQSEKMLEAVPYPETHAYFDSLVVGAGDEVWVRQAHPFAGEPSMWTVVTRDGAALGTVTLPARMRLTQVGTDFIVGITKDENDIEHVGVYALRRIVGSGR